MLAAGAPADGHQQPRSADLRDRPGAHPASASRSCPATRRLVSESGSPHPRRMLKRLQAAGVNAMLISETSSRGRILPKRSASCWVRRCPFVTCCRLLSCEAELVQRAVKLRPKNLLEHGNKIAHGELRPEKRMLPQTDRAAAASALSFIQDGQARLFDLRLGKVAGVRRTRVEARGILSGFCGAAVFSW